MADVNYPAPLRGAIQASKSRGQRAGFRQSDAAAGPPYFEAFSDDVPTVWRFDLRFTRLQAVYFWSWLKSEAENGRAWFNMEIATEYDSLFGIQPQEVHFTSGGFPQLVSETRDVLTYTCEVISRQISQPSTDEIIFAFFEQYGTDQTEPNALDIAMNVSWPAA